MVLNSFDGINCTISISPRQLKAVVDALRTVGPQDLEYVHKRFAEKNFPHNVADIQAYLTSFILEVNHLTDSIHTHKEEQQTIPAVNSTPDSPITPPRVH